MTAEIADRAPIRLRAVFVRRATAVRAVPGIVGVTVICLAYYLWHGIGEHRAYLTTGYDLGIFDQAVRAYAHFQAPMVPLKGPGYNIFGDHFHPIIAIIAPLYWIWDDPLVLVIVQAVLIAASVPIVYRFTRRRAGELLSLVITAAYGLGWPVQSLIDFDFHEVAFATPLLALAIDALDRRDDRRLLICSGLLLLVREDLGVVVLLIALLRLAQNRRPRWPVITLAVGGVVAYFVTTSLIIPHFARGTGFAYGGQYDALGKNLPDAAAHLFTHPWLAVKLLFSPVAKTATLAYLLVPLALLPLRSRYALLSAPLLLERLFNSRHNLWQPHFHYNALPWMVLVLAMVDGADRLGLFAPTSAIARRLRAALVVWLVAAPVLLIYNTIPIRPTPITKMRDRMSISTSIPRARAAEGVVAFLPHNVCIEADNKLVPHLTPRDYVALPHTGTSTADFIALDLAARDVGNDGPKPKAVLTDAKFQGYAEVYRRGTMVVLRSADYEGPSSACAPLGRGNG